MMKTIALALDEKEEIDILRGGVVSSEVVFASKQVGRDDPVAPQSVPVTPEYTSTFFYDGWDLIEERIAYTNGTSTTIHYHWGKDLSGTIGGAGGVGGLIYLTISNAQPSTFNLSTLQRSRGTRDSSTPQLYIPYYDNNGNIMGYWDEQGNVVAEYKYDAFGNTISQSGPMSESFSLRFSTKYFDPETGLYYYGYRYYSPVLMRWLTRDPIEEAGGVNLYAMCGNNAINRIDFLGLYLTKGCVEP